jgi:hypothetical protein
MGRRKRCFPTTRRCVIRATAIQLNEKKLMIPNAKRTYAVHQYITTCVTATQINFVLLKNCNIVEIARDKLRTEIMNLAKPEHSHYEQN